MGIGFANQGRYEASVAYYLRALELNPNAENAWGYLRISLGCTGRIDLMPLVDEERPSFGERISGRYGMKKCSMN